MPELIQSQTPPASQREDHRLLLSLILSPLAAGLSTIVGFIVAHWITITAYKRTGYLVSTASLVLCATAAWIAFPGRQNIASSDDAFPHRGRRLFMAKLALLLAALCALVVIADMLILVTIGPSD